MPVRFKFTLRDYVIFCQLVLFVVVFKNGHDEAKIDKKIAKAVAKKIEKDFNITENRVLARHGHENLEIQDHHNPGQLKHQNSESHHSEHPQNPKNHSKHHHFDVLNGQAQSNTTIQTQTNTSDHIYYLEIPHHSSFNSNFDPENEHHKRSNHEKVESIHEVCAHVDHKVPVRKYCSTLPTVHVHIPKAAGTSLDHTISHILTEKHNELGTSSSYREVFGKMLRKVL